MDHENDGVSLGWSDFALFRHTPSGTHVWFRGTPEELVRLVRGNWSRRRPGAGRSDLD